MVQSLIKSPTKPIARARLPDSIAQRLATITLGRPSSPDCRHYGICRIEAVSAASVYLPDFRPQATGKCGNQVVALVSFRPPDFLELAIMNSTVSAAVFKEHFSNGCFFVEESYWLPFGFFHCDLMLRSGLYNIEITDTMIMIQLSVLS